MKVEDCLVRTVYISRYYRHSHSNKRTEHRGKKTRKNAIQRNKEKVLKYRNKVLICFSRFDDVRRQCCPCRLVFQADVRYFWNFVTKKITTTTLLPISLSRLKHITNKCFCLPFQSINYTVSLFTGESKTETLVCSLASMVAPFHWHIVRHTNSTASSLCAYMVLCLLLLFK